MSERAEQFQEVRQMLEEAAKYLKVPMTGKELDAMAARLMPFYGKELFSTILAIANNDKYMPSGLELENRVRKAMGKPAMKGFTDDLIDKNVEELVRSGVPRDKAEKGARFLKDTLKAKTPEVRPEIQAAFAGNLVAQKYPETRPAIEKALATMSEDPLAELGGFGDPLAELEDFGDEPENPVAALEDF
jgi:hypothetical protein